MAAQLKKTVMPSGGDYTSLEACMNANEQNLVTADKYFDVEIDGTWSSADTTAVTIHNYTTDASRYVNVYTTTTARHKGVWSTSYYQLVVTSWYDPWSTISVGVNYTKVTGLQIKRIVTTGNYGSLGCMSISCNSGLLDKNFIYVNDPYGNNVPAIRMAGSTNSIVKNNFLYRAQNANFGLYTWDAVNAYIYNNTFYNFAVAIDCPLNNPLITNNISQGGASNALWGEGHGTLATNLGIIGDTTAQINASLTFNNAAGLDFHLDSTDTDAIGAGTDLSTIFPDDIDGNTRPSASWDVGADQYEAGYPLYTRQDIAALPADDTDLSGTFSATDYTDVSSDNNAYVDQISNGKYALFLFKDQYSFQSNITVTWIGKSDRAPSTSLVKLQIYDRDGTTWEDLDEENGVGAGTEFTLTGTITADLDHYYDANFVISCRVYQQAI